MYSCNLDFPSWDGFLSIQYFVRSLPDPVPLEKDGDGNPIRIDIPKPVLDDYITVSCAYI